MSTQHSVGRTFVGLVAVSALLLGTVVHAAAQMHSISSFGGIRNSGFGSSRGPTGPVGGPAGSGLGGGMRGPGPGLYSGLAAGVAGSAAIRGVAQGAELADAPASGRSGKKKSSKPSGDVSTVRNNSGLPPANEHRYVADEIVLALTGNPQEQAIAAVARRFHLIPLEQQRLTSTDITLHRWRIADRRSVPAVIRELKADRAIATVQPNFLFDLQQEAASVPGTAKPDEPVVGPVADDKQQEPFAERPYGDPAQYALGKLHLPEAHGLAKGDNVRVAVIDSGIDTSHPDLNGAIADQFDVLGSNDGPHAHGTGIAGVIAAHGKLIGAAPAVRILAVRAFGQTQNATEGTTFNIVKGIDWALDHGARIVNMSFAGPADPAMQRVLSAAHDKGVVLIAAAGNAGPKSPALYPAADRNVIAVTATDGADKIFDRANRGSYVAVAAPGVDILVPAPGDAYQLSSGTSFAAAYVSGIAALVLERKPSLQVDEVKQLLLSTAKDLGARGRDDEFGAGLADAYQALVAAGGAPVVAGGAVQH